MRIVRLGDVATAIRGLTFAGSDARAAPFPGGIACLTTAAVKPEVDWASARFIPEALVKNPQMFLRPGDILVSTTNSREKVGSSVRIGASPGQSTFGAFVCVIRAGDVVDSTYLSYWLRSDEFFRQTQHWITQTTGFANLSISDLLVAQVPLPDLATQRRIAVQLSQQFSGVDRLRHPTSKRALMLRELRANTVDEPYNRAPSHWPRRSVETVARLQSGYAFKSEWFTGAGVRLLRNANVGHDVIDWTNVARLPADLAPAYALFQLAEGDIVLSLDRPIVAAGIKVARLTADDVPSLLLQRVARFIVGSDVDADYLYHFLLTKRFISAISGHDHSLGVPHVSPRQVGSVLLPIPGLVDQRRIASQLRERLASIDAMDSAIRAEASAIDHLHAALLRRAFGNVAAQAW